MDAQGAWRATRQWVPFAARTIAYGTISLTLGPLTPDRSASLWAMRRGAGPALGAEHDVQVAHRARPAGAVVYCSNHQSVSTSSARRGAARRLQVGSQALVMKIPFWVALSSPATCCRPPRRLARRAEVIVASRRRWPRQAAVVSRGHAQRGWAGAALQERRLIRAVRAGVPVVRWRSRAPTASCARRARRGRRQDDAPRRGQVGAPIYRGRRARVQRVADLRDRASPPCASCTRRWAGTCGTRPPRSRTAGARA